MLHVSQQQSRGSVISGCATRQNAHVFEGTPEFMAPELVTDPEGIARTGEAFEQNPALLLGGSAPAADCAIEPCNPVQLAVASNSCEQWPCPYCMQPFTCDLCLPGWGAEVDIWAAGGLLFWMLSGRTPFDAGSVPQILHNVESGR